MDVCCELVEAVKSKRRDCKIVHWKAFLPYSLMLLEWGGYTFFSKLKT